MHTPSDIPGAHCLCSANKGKEILAALRVSLEGSLGCTFQTGDAVSYNLVRRVNSRLKVLVLVVQHRHGVVVERELQFPAEREYVVHDGYNTVGFYKDLLNVGITPDVVPQIHARKVSKCSRQVSISMQDPGTTAFLALE